VADVTVKVIPKTEETPKLDTAIVSAVADKLKTSQIDPAHILVVIEKITHPETHPDLAPEAIIEKLKELQADPAKIAIVLEKLKQIFPQAKSIAFDPVTAATVITTGVGVINKLNIGDTAKSWLIKFAIFVFGVFCGIGIVYKSGLPLPSDEKTVNPPANVSVYQKRIDELQTENAELRRQLEKTPQPQPPQPDGPPVWPLPQEPKTNPVTPPVTQPVRPGEIRPGFVLPK
jgi:hypothetical protein